MKNILKVTTKNVKKKSDINRRRINFNLLLIFAFCVGLVLIVVTYAWFSSSLNATVDFVKLTVSRETGLYASLDGVEYSNEFTIDEQAITSELNSSYPGHTNTWPVNDLIPISSNGISSTNNGYFDFYISTQLEYQSITEYRRFLDVSLYNQETNKKQYYLAFDLYLKNISNSPKPDNLYLHEGTDFYLAGDYNDEINGLFNSLRVGIVRIGHTSDKNATAEEVQAIECNNDCSSYIYEPNSTVHTDYSIQKLANMNINITNNTYMPTYAIIAEGDGLNHDSGHGNTPLDTVHFAEQNTYTDLNESLFELPHGITKIRVYMWLEGQDLDSIEAYTKEGGTIIASLNFYKDLAGYDL